ncbi:methylmalonyl-CoA mutase, partial [Archaeoglobales archaeon]
MDIDEVRKKKEEWDKKCLKPFLERSGERQEKFENLSWIEIDRVYDPSSTEHLSFIDDIGYPGEYPFTRGVYPTMYRGRLWTMRQFSGFGAA